MKVAVTTAAIRRAQAWSCWWPWSRVYRALWRQRRVGRCAGSGCRQEHWHLRWVQPGPAPLRSRVDSLSPSASAAPLYRTDTDRHIKTAQADLTRTALGRPYVRTLDMAPVRENHLRSAQVWHVFSRDLTVLPARQHVPPQSGWATPAFAFPAVAGTYLPIPEGWKAELAWDTFPWATDPTKLLLLNKRWVTYIASVVRYISPHPRLVTVKSTGFLHGPCATYPQILWKTG